MEHLAHLVEMEERGTQAYPQMADKYARLITADAYAMKEALDYLNSFHGAITGNP